MGNIHLTSLDRLLTSDLGSGVGHDGARGSENMHYGYLFAGGLDCSMLLGPFRQKPARKHLRCEHLGHRMPCERGRGCRGVWRDQSQLEQFAHRVFVDVCDVCWILMDLLRPATVLAFLLERGWFFHHHRRPVS